MKMFELVKKKQLVLIGLGIIACFVTLRYLSNLSVNDIYSYYKNVEALENFQGQKWYERIEEDLDLSKYPTSKVVATGYTAGVESTGKSDEHPEYGITYSGVRVRRDVYSTIAADLSVFPLGTILFIPGYGYGIVADKGGAIKGNRIDLFYNTVDEVYKYWGKQEVLVYIIKKGKGHLTEEEVHFLNEDEAVQVFRSEVKEIH